METRDGHCEPVDFNHVFARELDVVVQGREGTPADSSNDHPFERARNLQLVGLALSGGGIRSATFCLGVLQSLAKLGALKRIDYLSTVSGGGYIGSWLTSWCRRCGGIEEVEQALVNPSTQRRRSPAAEKPDATGGPELPEAPQVTFLREFSNYLTPRTGLMSVDTWVVGSTYLRNFINHFLIIVLATLALFVFPKFVAQIFHLISSQWLFMIAIAIMGACVFFVAKDMDNLVAGSRVSTESKATTQRKTMAAWVGPLAYVAVWLMTSWLWNEEKMRWDTERLGVYSAGIAFMYAAAWVLGFKLVAIRRAKERIGAPPGLAPEPTSAEQRWSIFTICVTAFLTGLLGAFLFLHVGKWFDAWPIVNWMTDACGTGEFRNRCLGAWDVAAFGPIWVVAIAGMTLSLHIGMAGHAFSQDAREWWSRVGASIGRLSLVIGVVSFVAIQGPWLLEWMDAQARTALASGWLATVASGYLAHRATVGKSATPGIVSRALLAVTPYVFIAGLLLALSWLANELLILVAQLHEAKAEAWHWLPALHLRGGLEHDPNISGWEWIVTLLLVAAAWLWSWRVGINRFSLGELYSNRLARCYLGASNPHRDKNTYTGFDPGDDQFSLHELLVPSKNCTDDEDKDVDEGEGEDAPPEVRMQGPYPIINTTLNMISGQRLAWQKRKGASFILSPLFCGFEHSESMKEIDDTDNCFVATDHFASDVGGIKLGTAIGISGAAVNPSMGQASTPAWSFLLSVLNMRLGRWVGNPRNPGFATRSGPASGLLYLIFEMMGLTTDKQKYVHLSDGGHFENLGIYELVRRNCRFIIACDAEHDPEHRYSGLGNAIEKCRTDFGVDIEIDVDQIRPDPETGLSHWHCAVGRIRYARRDPQALDGMLVYLKSSVVGDEPEDLVRYRAENPSFPHHTTADQWFDETQFESYRKLGEHAGIKVFGSVPKSVSDELRERFFLKLRERWYPPSTWASNGAADHLKTLDDLVHALRTSSDLGFLQAQMYPALGRLGEKHSFLQAANKYWAPENQQQLSAGFFFCKEAIVFMEGVFHDLHLEEEYDHPDNRGWMNLFSRWWWSRMFQFTWAVTGSTYGARFQTFCEHRLSFQDGEVRVGRDETMPWLSITRRQALDETALSEVLAANETGLGLNVFERKQIEDLVFKQIMVPCDVIPLCIEVGEDPVDEDVTHRINFGYALVSPKNGSGGPETLFYYRIQSHLRRMGLGRRGLVALIEGGKRNLESREGPTYEMEDDRATPDAGRQLRQMLLSVRRELWEKQERV